MRVKEQLIDREAIYDSLSVRSLAISLKQALVVWLHPTALPRAQDRRAGCRWLGAQ